uniref:Uncharacterized protein n=1 Tax=Acrobeloides nanus TaxID=290746 RepID=A0A914C7D9_9BILA
MTQILQFCFLGAIFAACYGSPAASPKDLQACLEQCTVNNTAIFPSRKKRNANADTASLANAVLENLGLVHAQADEIIENLCTLDSNQAFSCFEKCQEKYPYESLKKLLDILNEINSVACNNVNATITSLNCLKDIKNRNEEVVKICEQGNIDFVQKSENFVKLTHQNSDGAIVFPGKELCEVADSVQPCFEKYAETCGEVSLKIHNLLTDYYIFMLGMEANQESNSRCADIIVPPIQLDR